MKLCKYVLCCVDDKFNDQFLRLCDNVKASVDEVSFTTTEQSSGVCYKRKLVSKRAYISGGWYVLEENYTMKNDVNVPTSTKCTNRWVRFVFCNRPQSDC